MKKFKFTLQSLLNVKNSLEKQKTAELAAQNRVIRLLEDELYAMRRRLDESIAEYTNIMTATGMAPLDAKAWNEGFSAARDKIAGQLAKIARAEEVKAKIQKELTELMGERKMLEKFREQQYQTYLDDTRREDAKVIDDFLSNKIAGA